MERAKPGAGSVGGPVRTAPAQPHLPLSWEGLSGTGKETHREGGEAELRSEATAKMASQF